jgi:putative MATE family efflux protein
LSTLPDSPATRPSEPAVDRSTQLGQGSIPWLLVRFSTPAIVGMMAQALYNFIDAVFVGRAMGDDAIAAITVAFPCMLIGLAFSMLIGFGATALISIRLGEQRKAEAEQILGNAAVLLVLASLVLTVAGLLLLDPILRLFGANELILPYARDYLRIIILGTIFQMVGFGLNAAIRGEGNPRIAMLSMLISVVLNAILAPIFLFWFRWGMQGAGLATVISQAVSAAWVLTYFLSRSSVLHFHRRNLRLDASVCRDIFVIGSPPFAMQLAASVLQGIFNHQLRVYGGVPAIAVMGIIYRVLMMIAMPIFGINQGAQPIIGYNYGSGRFDRVKRTLETAVLAATTITLFGFAIMILFPTQVIRLFVPKDPELVALGVHAIRISVAMLPLIGFQIVSASYFQAVGKPRIAILLMLSRQLLILVPVVLLLPRLFGLNGVWAAMPTADLCASVLTGVCLTLELRHLRAKSST